MLTQVWELKNERGTHSFLDAGSLPTLSASGPNRSYPTPALYSCALWGSFRLPLCHTLPSRQVYTQSQRHTSLFLFYSPSLFLKHLLCVRDCLTLRIQRWTELSKTLRQLTVWGGTRSPRGNPALSINLKSYLWKSLPGHPVCTDLWFLTVGVIRIWNCKPPNNIFSCFSGSFSSEESPSDMLLLTIFPGQICSIWGQGLS